MSDSRSNKMQLDCHETATGTTTGLQLAYIEAQKLGGGHFWDPDEGCANLHHNAIENNARD